MSWSTSTRRSRLPRDWSTIRARILKRDQHHCHVCGKPGANEVDHLIAGDDHSDANLGAIHTACHKKKTSREATAARLNKQGTLQRETTPHPGLK